MNSSADLEAAGTNQELWGTVVSVQANYYWVRLEQSRWKRGFPKSTLLCTRRARLKKVGQRVIVGDYVLVEEADWEGERGAIAAVKPRQTLLDRPPVANADQILLIFALAEPSLDAHQLTRFLVKAELTGLDICLCLNKRDLVESESQAGWHSRLSAWGYVPIMISVLQDKDWMPLTETLKGRISVVSGPSGVGKSSLINKLIPHVDLRISAVSGKLGRGRHTTRHVELFELPKGGLLADTPGFNQPDLSCGPEALSNCFPEIRDRLQNAQCRFTDCLHREEPGCVVRGDWERYQDYLELLEECIAESQKANDSPDPDAVFKVKVAEEGKVQREPRLQAKKYRRVSRRSRKQTLQELQYELTGNIEELELRELELQEAEDQDSDT